MSEGEKPHKITPEQRFPLILRDRIVADGIPDFYDGPLYTSQNGAEQVAIDLAELLRRARAAESRTLDDEVAPLPEGFGQRADRP